LRSASIPGDLDFAAIDSLLKWSWTVQLYNWHGTRLRQKQISRVIPREVRSAAGVEVGDLLEAKAEAGKITFTPKSVIDRGTADSFADFAAGRAYGPFLRRTKSW
jgi:hypothetical protein